MWGFAQREEDLVDIQRNERHEAECHRDTHQDGEFAICSIELSVPVADTNHGQSLYSSRSWTLHKLKALTINDWIVDINYYEQSSQGHARIALLTAHNRLMLYEVDVCGKPIETRSVACQDTTLLLSGQIRIRQQDQRLIFSVAAGSISGNVTLWEWIHDEQTHHSVILQAVQTTLVGHRGAIYDLAFSPRGQKLCTASEDRTVRVWDLNKPAESPLVLWGHLGRVWRVHWWNCEQLTSVGEDCQALTWKLPASWSLGNPEYENHKPNIESSPKPFSIRQPPHDGRSIWSVTHDQETGYLLTGGADGKICTTLIEPTYPPEIQVKKITSVNRVPIKAFNISWDGSVVLYICQDGCIYTRFLADTHSSERLVFHHPSIFGCQCHLQFVPGSNCKAFLATNQGYLASIDAIGEPKPTIQIHNLGNTITMFAVCKTKNLVSGLIYDCKQNACLLYDISGYNEPKLIFRMCLKSMKTPTCMKLFEVQDPTGLFVFVGDVSGCLAVGKVGRTSGGNIGPKIALHGDGILDIELDQEHASICFQSCLRLSTLGRDGNYNKAFIRLAKNKFEILQTHQCPLTRGSLEAFLNFSSSSRYIGGFEKAFWKLFNLQSGTMIGSCQVVCNGQPNMWVCMERGSRCYLFYQQQGSILIENIPLPNPNDPVHFIAGLGSNHGREINCLKVFNLDGILEIVATGSENGVLEISLNERASSSQPLVRVYRNGRLPFAVKCMCWVKSGSKSGTTKGGGELEDDGSEDVRRDTLFLIVSGSRELFYTFRVTVDGAGCEAAVAGALEVGVVHWATFSQRSAHQSEVRVLDLHPFHLRYSTWLLSTAQSDGSIRVWSLDVDNKRQKLLFEHDAGCCVFSIQTLPIVVMDQREILVLAGLADGTVSVLLIPPIEIDITGECAARGWEGIELQVRLWGHQSGVKCVRGQTEEGGNRVMIATGGDDNGLVLHVMRFSRDTVSGRLVVGRTTRVQKAEAHAGSINGILLLRPREAGVHDADESQGPAAVLLSVSSDQRVKVWTVRQASSNGHRTTSCLQLSLSTLVHTHVADCTSIHLAAPDSVLPASRQLSVFVAGIGIHRLAIPIPGGSTSHAPA